MAFAGRDILDADATLATDNVDHPINQKERVAVRDHLHDTRNVDNSPAFAGFRLVLGSYALVHQPQFPGTSCALSAGKPP
ncbi:Hypothetical protein GbCGDNIH9_8485 [Granulibacter bethesdensis]|uniref:Uncharacterized protein n=1 Tax=Granulibacter bethesdensis TaxID=364410 RepID=A0AAC9K955_9PROT|nr:Hypothetical protein GbCGDNIH9_8485 [Granulibacter bethesdensis]APH61821.1 Hypothetical protein GbCGDNIH8_8485 [Granulibacter bethesdensis]